MDGVGTVRSTALVGGIAAVELIGEIDLELRPDLVAAIGRGLDVRNAVIVDLSNATFLDSSSLNAMITGRGGLKKNALA